MALSEPPNAHSKSSDGSNAACAVDASEHGSRPRNTTSMSLTMLCRSIANKVGIANRNTARYGEPAVTRFRDCGAACSKPQTVYHVLDRVRQPAVSSLTMRGTKGLALAVVAIAM